MRICLLGEYSNVHNGLSEGLKALGHEVCVISDGDGWKNYDRDIDISRRSTGVIDTLKYIIKLRKVIHRIKGYDIVQLINPMFLELRAEHIKPFYTYLRKHNHKLILGAFGMDYYWVKTCLDCKTFKYSDFNIGKKSRTEEPYNKLFIRDWLYGSKGKLNRYIAEDCDGIVCGLYEYFKCYKPHYAKKSTYIPFPIHLNSSENEKHSRSEYPIKFFIGIQKGRHDYKGTDIMLKALLRLKKNYPTRCEIIKAESVPFSQYTKMLDSSDILLDQLYSYTPGMNGLLAMSKGIILVGGGEEEHYNLLNENRLRPIINVSPDEDDVYKKLEYIVIHPEDIQRLSQESVEYVKEHHDYIKVANQYIDYWKSV